MVAHLAHNQETTFESFDCNHLWFAKEFSKYASIYVGTALTAGFMSLNKPGDRHKALACYNRRATFDPCD